MGLWSCFHTSTQLNPTQLTQLILTLHNFNQSNHIQPIPTQLNSTRANLNSTQISPIKVKSTQHNPTQSNSTYQTQPNSTYLNSNQLDLSQPNQSLSNPTQRCLSNLKLICAELSLFF